MQKFLTVSILTLVSCGWVNIRSQYSDYAFLFDSLKNVKADFSTYTGRYGLNFDESQWGLFYSNSVAQKSIDVANRSNYLNICSIILNNGIRERLAVYFQNHAKLLLPDFTAASSAEIALICKGENLKRIDLIITRFDKNENAFRDDTLTAFKRIMGEGWHEYKKRIALTEDAFWSLRVEAEGLDSTYIYDSDLFIRKAGHKDSTLNESLSLRKLDIYINGKHIDYYSPDERVHKVTVESSDIVPLALSNPKQYDKITELKNRRIIGLGETVHGSETMAEITVDIIKEQVRNNGCKLIAIEKMAEEMLLVNRFVQGDMSLHLDTLMKRFIRPRGFLNNLFSISQLKELCLWLREYNRTLTQPVRLLGMDYEQYVKGRRQAMADYLSFINKTLKLNSIDEICYILLKEPNEFTQHDCVQLRELWNQIRLTVFAFTGTDEATITEHFLFDLSNFWDNLTDGKTVTRDYKMSENIQFYIKHLCKNEEKVVISAHWGHTNYVDNFYERSMGYYLKRAFGDDYFHIGITTAHGAAITASNMYNQPDTLQQPIVNSIEHALDQLPEDCLYIPSHVFADSYAYIRSMGTLSTDWRYNGYISLVGRMGGIIFIRNCKATVLLSEIEKDYFITN
jgi:erythromycin esterase-like protein